MGVGKGPRRTSTRPRMSSAMNHPHLEHYSTARVDVIGSTISVPTCDMPALGHGCQFSQTGRPELLDNVIAVSGMHGHVFFTSATQHALRERRSA
jgi:hypothetical protein